MYCPHCFNDTLKLTPSGVVKFTFNGKAKATSQMFYNLKEDTEEELLAKLDHVIKDYFEYYQGFQNKDPIRNVEATSIDFKCSNGCTLSVNNRVNIIGLIFSRNELVASLKKFAPQYGLQLELEI
ncbi:MAG: hypothetical protein CME62_11260 [Halobacteriovoraceae bacterium]|nr:hypothetical protein [Halobacteriovoraceae bacterium]|tara:strand:- start:9153 stop:9527 length:375 start_codon:yes stop_codon:yes gene_type:complete